MKIPNKVSLINQQVGYDGFGQISNYSLKHELFEGGMSAPLHREVYARPPVSAVLPYDPQQDKIVLVRQFRIGAYLSAEAGKSGKPMNKYQQTQNFSPDSAWMLEVIAGVIEEGEVPEDVARREAKEEANIDITRLVPMHQYMPSPGLFTEVVHMFYGECVAPESGGVYGLASEGENIRVEVFDAANLGDILKAIDNAMTLVALQWFMLNRQRILRQSLK